MAKIADYDARLLINGEAWPISDFQYEEPEDTLGATLTATLADPELVIPEGARVDFEIGITVDGQQSWDRKVDNGVIAGHRAQISFAGDSLSMSSVNAIGDKWDLATREPKIYFDPAKVDLFAEQQTARFDLYDEDGNPIIPQRRAVNSLDLRQVLDIAFVQGCGFSRVVTNIQNYPIRRYDLSVDASYRASVQSFVDFFKPIMFPDDASGIYIIDIESRLPAGLEAIARNVYIKHYLTNEIQVPSVKIINAILLTYRFTSWESDEDFPANVRDRITVSEPIEATSPVALRRSERGQTGIVIITTHWKDFYDDINDPERITRSVPWKVEHHTFSRNQGEILLEQEHVIQTDYYKRNWLLQTGFDKTIARRAWLPGGGSTPRMIDILEERLRTTWAESNYNPDVYIKTNSREWSEGLVVIEGTYEQEFGDDFSVFVAQSKQPLTQANLNRNIKNDLVQKVKWLPIKTTIETWRDTGTNQVNVHQEMIDELTGLSQGEDTVQAIAEREVNLTDVITQTELIRNRDSEEDFGPRAPLKMDAGEVPYYIAKPRAQRLLERMGREPDRRRFELNHYDAALHRGSVRVVHPRTGDANMFIITTVQITGSALGTRDSDMTQTAGGVVVIQS